MVIECIGEPPPALALPPLATIETSAEIVISAVTPFQAADAATSILSDIGALETLSAAAGLTLIYIVGHAWLDHDRYHVAMRDGGGTRILTGAELLDHLGRAIPADACGVCFVDTCVAASLRKEISTGLGDRCTFIFASSETENALEYPLDKATRFTLTLRDILARMRTPHIDVVHLAIRINEGIAATPLMPPQAVTYWNAGSALFIERRTAGDRARGGWRTYRLLRAVLIGAGSIASIAAMFSAIYYYNHERIRIELGDLHSVASDLRVEIRLVSRTTTRQERVDAITAGGSPAVRFIAPASNLLVTVTGHYSDAQSRVIHFHLDHAPSWNLFAKQIVLRVPSAADARQHPNMAYIPETRWLSGEERKPHTQLQPFWIDLAPVTVEAYLPLAQRFLADKTIPDSVLVHDIENAAGVEATGMQQLPQLTENLSAIFGVIDAAQRPVARTEPYRDTAALLPRVHIACVACPAPMTLDEARAYCKSRRMRLPTRDEWELAARGTDGRRFPWGDAWNDAYANAGLPREVGKPKRPEPSTKFAASASPFGVIDLVGNEGDWIDGADYDRTFMGGCYRFNADECTVYAQTPDTGDFLPLYEITCRCVSSSTTAQSTIH